jgi:hypothetical protein
MEKRGFRVVWKTWHYVILVVVVVVGEYESFPSKLSYFLFHPKTVGDFRLVTRWSRKTLWIHSNLSRQATHALGGAPFRNDMMTWSFSNSTKGQRDTRSYRYPNRLG